MSSLINGSCGSADCWSNIVDCWGGTAETDRIVTSGSGETEIVAEDSMFCSRKADNSGVVMLSRDLSTSAIVSGTSRIVSE